VTIDRLDGKVVLVTGSARGIGRAVAEEAAARGAGVVVNSSSSHVDGEALADSLSDAIYVGADVSDDAQVRHLVDAVRERWGRLDMVVHCAATTRWIPMPDLDAAGDDAWDLIIRVNLYGSWYVARAAAPLIRESGGGSIVFISSMAGIDAVGSSIPYAVSKAAVNHLTRLLAKALAPDIRVNAVAPGFVDTRWVADMDADRKANVMANTPLRRVATPADIAHISLALACNPHTTGQVLPVEGGMRLK
jgi:ketoreductase RED2